MLCNNISFTLSRLPMAFGPLSIWPRAHFLQDVFHTFESSNGLRPTFNGLRATFNGLRPTFNGLRPTFNMASGPLPTQSFQHFQVPMAFGPLSIWPPAHFSFALHLAMFRPLGPCQSRTHARANKATEGRRLATLQQDRVRHDRFRYDGFRVWFALFRCVSRSLFELCFAVFRFVSFASLCFASR